MKRSSSDAIGYFVLALPFQMVSQKQGAADLTGGQRKAVYDSRNAVMEMEDPAFHPWIGGSQPAMTGHIIRGQSGDFRLGRISVRC